MAVVGAKDRATKRVASQAVESTDKPTLAGFVLGNAAPGATVHTDASKTCHGLPRRRETVNHGVFEYVRGQAHTNGIESFRSMLKRGYVGTYHKISPKHPNRYVGEFAGLRSVREAETIRQMATDVAGMVGRQLMYDDPIADNGLEFGARS